MAREVPVPGGALVDRRNTETPLPAPAAPRHQAEGDPQLSRKVKAFLVELRRVLSDREADPRQTRWRRISAEIAKLKVDIILIRVSSDALLAHWRIRESRGDAIARRRRRIRDLEEQGPGRLEDMYLSLLKPKGRLIEAEKLVKAIIPDLPASLWPDIVDLSDIYELLAQ